MINPNPNALPQMLTPSEVAKFLKVSPATVRNMIKRGDLDAIQLKGGRGIYRIPLSAIKSLMGNDLSHNIENRSVFKF